MIHDSLIALLRDKNIQITPDFSGTILRNGSQWFTGKIFTLSSGKKVFLAKFADFKMGDYATEWKSEALDDEEAEELERGSNELRTTEREERERVHEQVKLELSQLWPLYEGAGFSPYFRRKGLGDELYGCRIDLRNERDTIVPLRDVHGVLWSSIQIGADGRKSLLRGGKKRECFCPIGLTHPEAGLPTEGFIYLCEGVATGISIFQATGHGVVCAGDASNLKAVAQVLKTLRPNLLVEVCADDDWKTTRPDGTPWNPGVEAAKQAQATLMCVARIPLFGTDRGEKDTDFNDLHARRGIDSVRDSLQSQASLIPLNQEVVPQKPKKFDEFKAAISFLQKFGENLIVQGKDIFTFDGKIWVHQGKDQDELVLLEIISALLGNGPKLKDLEATKKRALVHANKLPSGKTLFEASTYSSAFDDGTLYLIGKELSFVPGHRRGDFLSTKSPLKWEGDDSIDNILFMELFEEQFGKHPEREKILHVFEEQAAAILLPRNPHMWFHYGDSGRGKSTLSQSHLILVDERFKGGLDPAEMNGFMLEILIGMQVNINTDIGCDKPLPSALLKRFEDKHSPIPINRKNKKAVHAQLPGTHIYCANNLPPLFEKSSALTRRATLIEYTTPIHREGILQSYENVIWSGDNGKRQSPEDAKRGILNQAKRGLKRLIQSDFFYTQPECSKLAQSSWRENHDPVAQFLKDCREDGVRPGKLDGDKTVAGGPIGIWDASEDGGAGIERDEYRIAPTRLWEAFSDWHQAAYHKPPFLGRNRFCAEIGKIFELKMGDHGTRSFRGIGPTP